MESFQRQLSRRGSASPFGAVRGSRSDRRKPQYRRAPLEAKVQTSSHTGECQKRTSARVLERVIAAAAAGLLSLSMPCLAEIQTVAPQDATSLAKPLPQQTARKGRVWLVFLVGATGLFGAAVAIERNAMLFPAIAKANQAMAASRAAAKKLEQQEEAIAIERHSDEEGQEAVLQGLADARSKTLEESSSAAPHSQEAEPSGRVEEPREDHQNGQSGTNDLSEGSELEGSIASRNQSRERTNEQSPSGS